MTHYKVGLVGVIGHSGVVLEGIKQLGSKAHLAAIALEPESRARREALQQSPVVTRETRFYDDYREMLEKEDLDIAGVFGIDATRAQAIVDCAAAGLHICTEKPLAMTREELARVRDATEKARVNLTMLLTMRNEALYAAAKEVVASGAIGEVAQITAQKSYKLGTRAEWLKSRKTFSGVFPFVGIHMVDLMRWVSGREFTRVAAFQANVTRGDVIREMEDNASAVFQLDNRGTATLRIDFLRPPTAPTHGDDRLRLAGGRGVLEVRGAENFISLITHDSAEQRPALPPVQQFFVQFVRSLEGECPPPVPAADCFIATDICLRAREAADCGRILEIRLQ